MKIYHIKGKLKISVKQIIEVEIDEILERDYLVDAKSDLEDRYIEEIGALYPEAHIDIESAAGLTFVNVTEE